MNIGANISNNSALLHPSVSSVNTSSVSPPYYSTTVDIRYVFNLIPKLSYMNLGVHCIKKSKIKVQMLMGYCRFTIVSTHGPQGKEKEEHGMPMSAQIPYLH